jgi:hypothetical protein
MPNNAQEWSYGNPLVEQDVSEHVENDSNRTFLMIIVTAVIMAIGFSVILSVL